MKNKKTSPKNQKNDNKIYIHIRNYQKWRILDVNTKDLPLEARNYYMRFANEWLGGSFNSGIHTESFYKRKLKLVKNNDEEYKEFLELLDYENFKRNRYNHTTEKIKNSIQKTRTNRKNQLKAENVEYKRALEKKDSKRIEKIIEKSKKTKEIYTNSINNIQKKLRPRKFRKPLTEEQFLKVLIKRQTYQQNRRDMNDFYYSRTISKSGAVSDDSKLLNYLTTQEAIYSDLDDEFSAELYKAINEEKVLCFIKDQLVYAIECIHTDEKQEYYKKAIKDVVSLYDKYNFCVEVLEILDNKENLSEAQKKERKFILSKKSSFKNNAISSYRMMIYLLFRTNPKIKNDIQVLLNKIDLVLSKQIF